YLWEDNTLGKGASARTLANLPSDVVDALKELTTRGRQLGGLKAAAGVLDKALPAELGLLAILFQSAGFSHQYHIARLQMYLRDRGVLETVRQTVEKSGKSLDYHLQAMYVSDVLGQAIIDALPGFAANEAEARQLLKAQYPKAKEITQQEMLEAISHLLAVDDRIPCTLIVLDELQQHIGVSAQRSLSVQMMVEACCKQFSGRLLFVATGQSALSETTNLQKLMGRFPVAIELSDADVETVIRKLLLAKKPDQLPVVQGFLETHSGEVDRQLRNTRIGPRPEDLDIIATDYPILPVRQRFWERVLRAIDKPGTAAQLRTQLRMVHEALSSVADMPLGAVVPADFIFDQQYSQMKQAGLLLKDIEGTIQKYRDEPGQLKYKLCALAFLIGLLPRDTGADIGVRATPEMLSDLLVGDIADGGTELRKQVPELLEELAEAGDLMQIGEEYRIQTRESAVWEQEYRNLYAKFLNDGDFIAGERSQLLRGRVGEALNKIQVLQGKSKIARKLTITHGGAGPTGNVDDIPVWVRNGWDEKEASVKVDAQQMGTSSPIITVYLPQRGSDDFRRAIASWRAAEQVLGQRGTPTTDEGLQARSAMQTRMDHAQNEARMLAGNVISHAIVLQGGGGDVT
ncbi:MAG: BREX system P-loop protein BrxC, partial [Armatimonadia bacterium]